MTVQQPSLLIIFLCSAACFRTRVQGISRHNEPNDETVNEGSEKESEISSEMFIGSEYENVSRGGLNRRGATTERGLSHESKMNLLQLHNLYRSNVTPPAGNMAYMEWDDELARLAQEWSNMCVFEHGMPENDYPATIGQNLYLGSDPTGYLGLWMWFEEYLHYDLRKHSCLPRKQCGHYQQMAWAHSDRLGCGVAKCDKLRYILTCHYRNQALRGVHIYDISKPCSQCPRRNGALCLKSLCMSWEQCKQNPFDCQFARCDLECHNCGRLDKENCLCECTDGWDSPDCSRVCTNKSTKCGTKPGFPKESCFLYQHIVAEEKCRLMCDMCNPVDTQISNDTCCGGIICEKGFVLDHQSCKCHLLCPGPICDGKTHAKTQASIHSGNTCLTTNESFGIFLFMVLVFAVQVHLLDHTF